MGKAFILVSSYVDSEKIRDIEKFQTDLQLILGMLKCRNNKEAMMQYVEEHKDFFENVDIDTYYAIKEFIHSEKILKDTKNMESEEGTVKSYYWFGKNVMYDSEK